MLFRSTSDPVIRAEAIQRRMEAEKGRRARFAERFCFMRENYAHLVTREVERIFADPTNATRVKVLAATTLNLFKEITCELYQFKGAKRSFKRGTAVDPAYERITQEVFDFDLLGAEYTETLGGYNDGLIRILPGVLGIDEKGAPAIGPPQLRVFLPHEVMVVGWKAAPDLPRVVAYEEELEETGKLVTVVWTDQEHYAVTDTGAVVNAPGAASRLNPFGRLPFVAIHKGLRFDGFWDSDGGQDLVDFTKTWLAGWSAVGFLRHTQSFKQLVAIGVTADWTPPEKTGPGTIWRIPAGMIGVAGNADIKAIDVSTDPAMLGGSLIDEAKLKLGGYGVDVTRFVQNPGQTPPSGIARFIDRQAILERRRKVRPHQVEVEYAVAELYRWAWNWSQRPPSERIAEDAIFDLELFEETVVLSPQEKVEVRKAELENYKLERELGLRDAAEQFAEYNQVTVEEARKVLASRPAPTPPAAPPPARAQES